MTNFVGDEGTRILDFSSDSVLFKSRKGAGLLWNHRFIDRGSDGTGTTPVDVSTWTFRGGATNGTDPATNQPNLVDIDITRITTADNNMIQCYLDSNLLTNITPSGRNGSLVNFEIEAVIPTGRTDSNGDQIMLTQIVAVGQIQLFADIYTTTTDPNT